MGEKVLRRDVGPSPQKTTPQLGNCSEFEL